MIPNLLKAYGGHSVASPGHARVGQNCRMSTWVPPRLRSILGVDLDLVTAETAAGLLSLPEDTDLEFKSEPWTTTEGGSKECAMDVADKANAGGALVAIGVAESKEGDPHTIRPIEAAPADLALRIDQIVAERISPPPRVSHCPVTVSGGYVHLLSIGPSTSLPHAVKVGGGALRVPVRSGTTRRMLSEPEIADLYQRRFRTLQSHLDDVRSTRERSVRLASRHDSASDGWAWLALSLVPEYPGNLLIRSGIANEWASWIRGAFWAFPGYGRSKSSTYATTGFRTIVVSDSQRDGRPEFYAMGAELDVEGRGSLVLGCPKRESQSFREAVLLIFDELVFGDALIGIGVLANHALRANAGGMVTIGAEILTEGPVALGQFRGRFGEAMLNGSHQIMGATGFSQHSAQLDDIAVPGPSQVALTRVICADLFSAFGLEHVTQVVDDALYLPAFAGDNHRDVRQWAEDAGVPVRDT